MEVQFIRQVFNFKLNIHLLMITISFHLYEGALSQ